ncbi:hypothetical protein PVK06_011612 [Gossypium arboreum]|uniref:Retrovirus-related Pol polyprotein from transposon TNT 1-94 n=1 Tax=Gossypium arboreum TaxID=29729 RepID=A0ABR0QAI5_GOSAR|nr:hypothetical protein PVK06_011612 [Gossypium arboreum]
MVSEVPIFLGFSTWSTVCLMDSYSSPSAVQSITPVMVSNLTNGVVDSHFFSTKKINVLLDNNNYLLWRQQLLDDTGLLQENPTFARFKQQHSALASWLLSSVSPIVLPHIIGLDTSAQIWNALVNLYGNQTTSRLMFYRRVLHSQRKADLSIKDFFYENQGIL